MRIIILILILLCSSNAYAVNGYITEVSTGNKVSYFDLQSKPADTNEYTFTVCDIADLPELYEEPIPESYDGDELITWALQQVFAEGLIPHMAAFLDFANKATEASKANFLAYAQAVSLTSTANTIVAKAIELGANLEE